MTRAIALLVAAAALVVACNAAASPSAQTIITTAPPLSTAEPGASLSLAPATFLDQSPPPSGVASQPPLIPAGPVATP